MTYATFLPVIIIVIVSFRERCHKIVQSALAPFTSIVTSRSLAGYCDLSIMFDWNAIDLDQQGGCI